MIEYITHNWYYLNWDNEQYYTKFHSQILTPISLGLGMHQTPLINAFRLMGDSKQTMVVSGSPKDVPICEGSSVTNLQNNTRGGIPNCGDSLAFGFDDSACLLTNMATTTMQEVKTTRELA